MRNRLVLSAAAAVALLGLSLGGCTSLPVSCTIEEQEEKQSFNLPVLGEVTTQEKEDDFNCGMHNVEVTNLPQNVDLSKGVTLTNLSIGGEATLVGLDKDNNPVTFSGQTDD